MSETPANDELTYFLDERRVILPLDESLYPLDAIYGTAYLFVDRCWVHLRRPADGKVEVRLKTKGPADQAALEALAGEFANELLDQVCRQRIGAATGHLREYYMARAFFGDPNRASIDALLAELDQEELAADPLEISVPWEEKGG